MPKYNCVYTFSANPTTKACAEDGGVKARLVPGDPRLRVEGVCTTSPEEAPDVGRDFAERLLDAVARTFAWAASHCHQ